MINRVGRLAGENPFYRTAFPKRPRRALKNACMTEMKEILIQVGSVMFECDWPLTTGPEL